MPVYTITQLNAFRDEYLAGRLTEQEFVALLTNHFVSQGLSPDQAGPVVTNYMTALRAYQPTTTPDGALGGGDLNIGGLGPGARFGPSRKEAIELQEAEDLPDVFSRYLQTLPGYTGAVGYAQRAMEKKAAPAQAQYELMGAFQPPTGQQTFSQFLGGAQPTPGQMRGQLGQLTTTLGLPVGSAGLPAGVGLTPEGKPMPGVEDILRTMYGSQSEAGRGRQFQASIQPLLAEIAPYFRQFFQTGASRRAGAFMAAQPQTDWLAEARRLGYF